LNKFKNIVVREFNILLFGIIIILSISTAFSQNLTSEEFSTTNLELENPTSIEENYTYDPISDRYFFNQSVGDFNINYPIILSPKEYEDLILDENLKKYYKDKIKAAEGRLDGSEDLQKNLIPEIYVNSKLFESIFGGNTIEVVPQGSLEIDLGVLYTKQDNPSFSPRNRSNFSFDFDQRIGLSLLGKVGTRVQVNANFDTQSTFDFQNLMQIQYEPTEDDIIKKIEVGNVSMPLNSSLITGAQSLFGFKTELQFGKTRVTAVFSEQKSEAKTVVAQAGGTIEEFQFRALDYDENRHFFLSHAFREKYDQALLNYPYVNSNIQITRTEVWVTNRNNTIDNVRNIVAFQDLGESSNLASNVNIFVGPNANPDNANNGFNPLVIGQSDSQLTNSVRDIATIQSGILLPNVNEGYDYGKLENAKKLNTGSDYTVNTQLGYISLNQKLDNDEILAVAFQYTIGDQVYQVGEFANDGVQATEISNNNDNTNPVVNNNNLIVKLLKSTVSSVEAPMWKLMMKNIYNTGSFQLEEDGFKLNIFYNESSPLNYITPVDGVPFPTTNANDLNITETPLLNLFNFDRLNSNNDPQFRGDGFFDFVPGITVLQNNGKIIFTKVEPFGEFLFEKLRLSPNENYDGNEDIADDYNLNQKKYVYSSLYKSSKTIALQDSEKNKFQITGKYKSSSGSGIPIGAYNVPRGSVNVTAGGRVLTEGVDYTVNYQAGTVQILDPALQSSGTYWL